MVTEIGVLVGPMPSDTFGVDEDVPVSKDPSAYGFCAEIGVIEGNTLHAPSRRILRRAFVDALRIVDPELNRHPGELRFLAWMSRR